jgi:hypothetical protein
MTNVIGRSQGSHSQSGSAALLRPGPLGDLLNRHGDLLQGLETRLDPRPAKAGARLARPPAEQAMQSARRAALSVLASVRAAVGDLDRIAAWATVTGFVQAQPGYAQTTAIINGFSQVLIDVFCPQGFGLRHGVQGGRGVG